MSTTDRIANLDTARTITDKLGGTVVLGSGISATVADLDAIATVIAAGASEVRANFSMIAGVTVLDWFNGSSGLWITELDSDAAASAAFGGGEVKPAAQDYDALALFQVIPDQELYEMRNLIINGNFDFWQRGTNLGAAASLRYLADRWLTNSSGTTVAPSRQAFTLGQTAVPGEPTYFHRTVVATSAGAGNFALHTQRIESVRTLAGQSATLTFWAKADASKNIAVEFVQNFGTGGAPSAEVTSQGVTTCALTTSWQKFQVSVTLASISGKTLGSNNNDFVNISFWFDAGSSFNARTNTLGQQSGTFDIAQVQIEAGAVATTFEVRPFELELSLCQRYYEKTYNTSVDPATISVLGMVGSVGNGTSSVRFFHQFRVCKRVAPTTNTVYNPNSGASGSWRNYGAGSDVAMTIADVGETGLQIHTGGTTPGSGQQVSGHVVVEAEL